jgi:uncharacterized membrane protein (UPF0127 family)
VTAGAALALALAGAACRGEPAAAAAPGPGRARVLIQTAAGEVAVVAELARTDEERGRGLMFRERLRDDEGMLFVFEEEDEHRFWMKNTLIPLDMIFALSDGRIGGILEHAQPGSLELRNAGPSRFVLEVNGGWAAARGVRPGDRLTWYELPR